MKKKLTTMILAVIAGAIVLPGVAGAHTCEDPNDPSTCYETPVVDSWRDGPGPGGGNYIPLFDITDRDDPENRKEAQRWRQECEGYYNDGTYHSEQQCFWLYGGQSFLPNDDGGMAPNELHAGYAANHCFLAEAQHQCDKEGHEPQGEGMHDAHGGAIYVDVCLTENQESRYCDDGLSDTQAGVTVMDHLSCGLIVPIVSCIDEYHVIRPFDQAYTEEQMEESQVYLQWIIENPEAYLCGKPEYRGGNAICPAA